MGTKFKEPCFDRLIDSLSPYLKKNVENSQAVRGKYAACSKFDECAQCVYGGQAFGGYRKWYFANKAATPIALAALVETPSSPNKPQKAKGAPVATHPTDERQIVETCEKCGKEGKNRLKCYECEKLFCFDCGRERLGCPSCREKVDVNANSGTVTVKADAPVEYEKPCFSDNDNAATAPVENCDTLAGCVGHSAEEWPKCGAGNRSPKLPAYRAQFKKDRNPVETCKKCGIRAFGLVLCHDCDSLFCNSCSWGLGGCPFCHGKGKNKTTARDAERDAVAKEASDTAVRIVERREVDEVHSRLNIHAKALAGLERNYERWRTGDDETRSIYDELMKRLDAIKSDVADTHKAQARAVERIKDLYAHKDDLRDTSNVHAALIDKLDVHATDFHTRYHKVVEIQDALSERMDGLCRRDDISGERSQKTDERIDAVEKRDAELTERLNDLVIDVACKTSRTVVKGVFDKLTTSIETTDSLAADHTTEIKALDNGLVVGHGVHVGLRMRLDQHDAEIETLKQNDSEVNAFASMNRARIQRLENRIDDLLQSVKVKGLTNESQSRDKYIGEMAKEIETLKSMDETTNNRIDGRSWDIGELSKRLDKLEKPTAAFDGDAIGKVVRDAATVWNNSFSVNKRLGIGHLYRLIDEIVAALKENAE